MVRKSLKVGVLTILLLSMVTSTHAFLGGMKWSGTFEAESKEVSWEYRTVPISLTSRIEDGTFERELNKLGSEGWELSSVVTTQSGGYYIMKRPKI